MNDSPASTLATQATVSHNELQQRLEEALAEYHEAADSNRPIEREEFLEKYADIRHELSGYLDSFDLIRAMAPELADTSGSTSTSRDELPQRATLGDFRILREIGRGGMGVVYEAEQLSIGRRVALKVLPFAAMLDKQQLNRFKNEARAAGTLDHPNIVAIHSVGCERGVHYYAMQLIEGQSLAQAIEQLRRESGRPEEQKSGSEVKEQSSSAVEQQGGSDSTSALPLYRSTALCGADTAPVARLSTLPDFDTREYFRAIAQLGIQAAEALDHAHQNGILHRDIKPANLLVDDTGKLWITDFGLARMEQDAGMTMTGDILGTLRYMSPEQALAKRVVVDHRSDIYSLGVTLYELLTLQSAFTGEDRQELLREIAFDEPRKLRQISARIPRDFETIILKAIEKNPIDRYSTAHELADDLLRFLDDQPIKAKPQSLLAASRKWSRRHRGLIAAIGILLAILTVGSLASSALLIWERERTQQAIAESNAVVDFLVKDLLAAPLRQVKLDREVTVSEVLARADRRIESALAHAPLVEAKVRWIIAAVYNDLLKYDLAEPHARRALALRQELLGAAHSDTLESTDTLAIALGYQGKFDDARKISEQTLEAIRLVKGAKAPDTLAAMKILVRVYIQVWHSQNRPKYDIEYAERLCRETLELANHILGPDHQETLGTKYDLASLYMKHGKEDKALPIFEETLEASQKVLGDQHHLTVALLRIIPVIYSHQGKLEQAAQLFEKALQVNGQVWGTNQANTLTVMSNLGAVYSRLGNHGDAWRLVKEAYERSREIYGPKHQITLICMRKIAATLPSQARIDECRKTIAIILQDIPQDELVARNDLAWFLATTKADELRDGKLAVELAEKAYELSEYKDPGILDTLAAACAETGDFEAAVKWSQKSIELAVNDAVREEFTRRLESFKAGKPWRE
jgi:serine/threonine protein kinase/tetratricopeptide (TPR) repeat protein